LCLSPFSELGRGRFGQTSVRDLVRKGVGRSRKRRVWGAVQRVLQVLFDLSFASFITARVVKTIYLLAIIFMVLYVLSTVGWLFFLLRLRCPHLGIRGFGPSSRGALVSPTAAHLPPHSHNLRASLAGAWDRFVQNLRGRRRGRPPGQELPSKTFLREGHLGYGPDHGASR